MERTTSPLPQEFSKKFTGRKLSRGCLIKSNKKKAQTSFPWVHRTNLKIECWVHRLCWWSCVTWQSAFHAILFTKSRNCLPTEISVSFLRSDVANYYCTFPETDCCSSDTALVIYFKHNSSLFQEHRENPFVLFFNWTTTTTNAFFSMLSWVCIILFFLWKRTFLKRNCSSLISKAILESI